ncbi:hypothetical protein, partial [Penaeicola halotolerans]|uniref:hypothetical protein n=1 Tax=Penaeicola halotolerans TaxID=2793196 RepID=UPI001CF8F6EC
TVEVIAPAIVAVDDTPGTVNGFTGAANLINVLANDSYNGVTPAALTETELQVVTPFSNANVTLDITTGEIDVAAGTAAGTYTLVYRLVDSLNPSNTDEATVTVVVAGAGLVANDDPETINGFVGGSFNVLDNDTYNADPATTGEVTITQLSIDAGLNFNPGTGEVTVAAGTAAGTYTLTYRLTDNIDAANTDDATVTVTVEAAAIDAVDDDVTGINGKDENLGVVNVLANDRLNGVAVNPADVTLTRTSPVVGSPLTLNADGSVDVAAETAAGIYTLTYQISENLNPSNTDQATVTVEVIAPAIVAVDDTPGTVNGFTGADDLINVLANDSYNGVTPAALTETELQVVTPFSNANVTLDITTGEIDVAAGTAAGTYTLVYRLVDSLNPSNTDEATVTVVVAGAGLVANDDPETINGFVGGSFNVLANDTY